MKRVFVNSVERCAKQNITNQADSFGSLADCTGWAKSVKGEMP
jgi:hypothetical protein